MIRFESPTPWALFGALTSALALLAALYLQISKDWFPCPLCIVQRYGFLLSFAGFLGLMLFKPRRFPGVVFVAWVVVGVGGGLGTALYHLWVLANPLQTCGVDPLQVQLNALPWVQAWPDMFMADGLCTEEYPPLLGLSLPAWAAVGFGFQALMAMVVWRKGKPARRRFS